MPRRRHGERLFLRHPDFRPAAVRPRLAEAAAVEAPKGAHGEFSDFSPAGVERSNPLHAPSPFEEWKEDGYSNVAGKDWTHWEGIADEHLKHFAVKLDPADVEDRGLFWNIFTNYKTAIPAAIIVGFPLIGQGHIHMDWHVEAAAIFWTVIYGISSVAKDGMYSAISSGPEAKKAEVRGAEAGYEEALRSTMEAHEKALALPAVFDELNAAVARLHEIEAKATTVRVKRDHRAKMVAMLDYMVQVANRSDEGVDLVISSTLDAVEGKLASDSAFAQAVLDEAIESFTSGNTSTKVIGGEFAAQLKAFEANPPVDATVDPEAEDAKARDTFCKRFGYGPDAVTQDMLDKAVKSPAAMAYLSARCGGVAPTLGTPISERMPIDF